MLFQVSKRKAEVLPWWFHLSSLVTSFEPRRFFSLGGNGGGDDDGPGETDFWRDERRDPRDGVL